MKSSLRLVLVLFVLLCHSGMVTAQEVAMISNVTGSVSASLKAHQWTPTTAETLSNGTILEVGPGATLSLIHLLSQTEYTATTPQKLTISATGINGAQTEVLVLAGIPQGMDIKISQIQDGGAYDKGQDLRGREEKNKETKTVPPQGSSLEGQNLAKPNHSDSFDELPSGAAPAPSATDNEQSDEPPAGNHANSVARAPKTPKSPTVTQTVLIALPNSYEPVGATIVALPAEEQPHRDWKLYSVSLSSPETKDISLHVKIDGNDPREASVSLTSRSYAGTPIGGILQLEGEKNLELAAAKWLELLRDPKYNQDVVEKHLNRLAQQFRAKWVQ